MDPQTGASCVPTSKKERKEVLAFQKLRPKLQILYGSDITLSKLAQLCYAKELILLREYEKIFDTNHQSEFQRTDYFLLECLKVAIFNESEGVRKFKQYMSTLAEIVRYDSSIVMDQTSKTIGKYYYIIITNKLYTSIYILIYI